jgi:hypothetical protein
MLQVYPGQISLLFRKDIELIGQVILVGLKKNAIKPVIFQLHYHQMETFRRDHNILQFFQAWLGCRGHNRPAINKKGNFHEYAM